MRKVIKPTIAKDNYIGRVHIIERTVDDAGNLALNDYLRFEFERYKRHKAAGEDIRIAWTEPDTWPRGVGKKGEDFWLFDAHTDHARVAKMVYTPEGQFEKAVVTNAVGINRRAHEALQGRAARLQALLPLTGPMLDKELAVRAAAAMQRAARFGISPIPEDIIESIDRALAGLTEPPKPCPYAECDGERISCPDDHVQSRDREDPTARR